MKGRFVARIRGGKRRKRNGNVRNMVVELKMSGMMENVSGN